MRTMLKRLDARDGGSLNMYEKDSSSKCIELGGFEAGRRCPGPCAVLGHQTEHQQGLANVPLHDPRELLVGILRCSGGRH